MLVCLKTGISGCGSPFLIFLYAAALFLSFFTDASASEKSFSLRAYLMIKITSIMR